MWNIIISITISILLIGPPIVIGLHYARSARDKSVQRMRSFQEERATDMTALTIRGAIHNETNVITVGEKKILKLNINKGRDNTF